MKPMFLKAAFLITVCSLTPLGGYCASNLKDAKVATSDAIRERAAERSGLAYLNNDTYLANPGGLLGSVLVLRSSGEKSPEEPQFELTGFRGFNRVSSDPKYEQTVQSLIVNKSLAADVTFLSFFKSQLSTSNVLSMTVRDEIIQRSLDDEKWSVAFENWKKDTNNLALLKDPSVRKILVVRGFVMKSVTYKNYTLSKGSASGAYGVSVGGSLYSSSDENRIVYLWGVDYGVIYSAQKISVLGPGNAGEFSIPRNPSSKEAEEISRALSEKKCEGAPPRPMTARSSYFA